MGHLDGVALVGGMLAPEQLSFCRREQSHDFGLLPRPKQARHNETEESSNQVGELGHTAAPSGSLLRFAFNAVARGRPELHPVGVDIVATAFALTVGPSIDSLQRLVDVLDHDPEILNQSKHFTSLRRGGSRVRKPVTEFHVSGELALLVGTKLSKLINQPCSLVYEGGGSRIEIDHQCSRKR